jgi:hypothetical protein
METSMPRLDDTSEAFARLSMLEFVLEVVLANQLLELKDGEIERITADLVRVSEKAYGAMASTPETINILLAQHARSVEMTSSFAQKVRRRIAGMRHEQRQG